MVIRSSVSNKKKKKILFILVHMVYCQKFEGSITIVLESIIEQIPVLMLVNFSPSCNSLADTYSDGLGSLDFERSQLGSGMSQRSSAKRLVNALHSHSQKTNQKLFDLQTIRSMAEKVNIKVNKNSDVLKVDLLFYTFVKPDQ